MIVYLHGFNSSASQNSNKLNQLKRLKEDLFVCSYDSFKPASEILEKLIADVSHLDECIFVGTSMGGLFAAQLAKHFGAPSILFNPLFNAAEYLNKIVGIPLTNFVTNEVKALTRDSADSYNKLTTIADPSLYETVPLVIVAKDDHILCPKRSMEYFKNLIVYATDSGGHQFDAIDAVLPTLQQYCNHSRTAAHFNH
jgi:predicted esterase YcpF (UPF0227 family)